MRKYRKLEDIDFSMYKFDPVKGVWSNFWNAWLTGFIRAERRTGIRRRRIHLTDKGGVGHDYFFARVLAYLFVPREDEFKDVPYECLEVDHINGDSLDDSIENLRWTDHFGNMNNPITLERNRISSTGKHHSEETKKALSESRMGEKNPNYGKHPSEESRRKMSESRKGEKNHNYGKHRTEEEKLKNSLSQPSRKRVIQRTLDGEIVDRYHSQSEASRKTGLAQANISACCLGKHKTCGGFIFSFE